LNSFSMVKLIIEELSSFLRDLTSFIPPGIVLAVPTAFIEGGKYFSAFQHEFVGTLIMIVCTFSAGKWIGMDDFRVAWASHAAGVVTADYIGGGPNVNPAVTVSMWTLGKCSYTESFVRIAGQICGGLIAFPLYHAISKMLDLQPFGGPEFYMNKDELGTAAAAISEFFATMLLCFAIYILNWEINFGKLHYIIKQTLTAGAIRGIIEFFPTAGPAINPMLATTWNVFAVGKTNEFPSEFEHYFVYWLSPCLAAIVASIIYTIYAGGTVFGKTLPIGPIKKPAVKAAGKKKSD
jgi:glycerol uptake facilitator-like aquaporin